MIPLMRMFMQEEIGLLWGDNFDILVQIVL